MKRREFSGLAILSIGAMISSTASFALTPKKATSTNGSTPASNEVKNNEPNNYFYVTLTTIFPYPMAADKYRELSKSFRDNSYTDDRLEDMKREKKLLRMTSILYDDNVTTCYEFQNEAAWKEYVQIYDQNKSNSSEKKKQLGFQTKKEFKKSSIMT